MTVSEGTCAMVRPPSGSPEKPTLRTLQQPDPRPDELPPVQQEKSRSHSAAGKHRFDHHDAENASPGCASPGGEDCCEQWRRNRRCGDELSHPNREPSQGASERGDQRPREDESP